MDLGTLMFTTINSSEKPWLQWYSIHRVKSQALELWYSDVEKNVRLLDSHLFGFKLMSFNSLKAERKHLIGILNEWLN